MKAIRAEYEDRFADVFKRITADNGSEFEDFSLLCASILVVGTPCERATQRHNAGFFPKASPLNNFPQTKSWPSRTN